MCGGFNDADVRDDASKSSQPHAPFKPQTGSVRALERLSRLRLHFMDHTEYDSATQSASPGNSATCLAGKGPRRSDQGPIPSHITDGRRGLHAPRAIASRVPPGPQAIGILCVGHRGYLLGERQWCGQPMTAVATRPPARLVTSLPSAFSNDQPFPSSRHGVTRLLPFIATSIV